MAKSKEVVMTEQPEFGSYGWSEYCLKTYFGPGETDQDGNPKVHGLRRVAEEVIGPIVDTHVVIAQAPSPENDYTAAVTCRIGFASIKLGRDIYFAAEADVTGENCEPMFARFATATAGTRAEGRALRKALKLNKCAAEELTKLPVVERASRPTAEPIQTYQVNGILKQCRDMSIDPLLFVNQGGSRYASIEEMSKEGAIKALKLLAKYFQDHDSIPKEILL